MPQTDTGHVDVRAPLAKWDKCDTTIAVSGFAGSQEGLFGKGLLGVLFQEETSCGRVGGDGDEYGNGERETSVHIRGFERKGVSGWGERSRREDRNGFQPVDLVKDNWALRWMSKGMKFPGTLLNSCSVRLEWCTSSYIARGDNEARARTFGGTWVRAWRRQLIGIDSLAHQKRCFLRDRYSFILNKIGVYFSYCT